MSIHREGYIFIVLATVLWIIIWYTSNKFLGNIPWLHWSIQFVYFLLWFWVLWFFRIPTRDLTRDDSLAIAPADGKVVVIEEVYEPEYFKDQRLQVSIFMSPLNVHQNLNPISGVVKYFKYHPGKYLVAWHPKSSTLNERTSYVISNGKTELLTRQIAGAMARRIAYYVKEGDSVEQTKEFGFIRFGSRVDVFFPVGTPINVKIGDITQGGVTVLAKMP
ncbi:MAG: phosphatidylserine decarboxylase family protein [Chitinophagales bacterium]|nr:phosphatidylserine decarboxylase family protein [Chitinophagales bacterium]